MKTQRILPSAKVFLSIFRIKAAEGFQYRMAILAGATTGIFWALIEITVYSVFYKYASNRNAGLIAGMSLNQVISYAWLTQVLFLLQPHSLDSEILTKINNGDIGIELCRPIDLYVQWFSKTSAGRLAPLFWRGSVTMAVGFLMPESYHLSLPASVPGFLWFLLSTASALLLCSSFAMLASVLRLGIVWGDGPTYILILVGSILSGGYLPLQLWPEFLQGFLLIQPFAGYLDIPLRLYLGTMPPNDAVLAVGLQLAWTAIFIAAGKLLMTRKLKNIIVQGG